MRRDDVRFAVAAREDGLRRVRSLTVRIGAVGVVSSAAIAVAFGHPAGAAIHNTTGPKTSPSAGPSRGNSPLGNSLGSPQPSTPQPSSSPSSSKSAAPRPHKSHPSSSPQPPAQSPAPVATSGQVVSGGS